MKYVKNFARFYALLKDVPGAYEGLKEQLVGDHTNGRTTHLHLMYPKEYERMCDLMQGVVNPSYVAVPAANSEDVTELKRRRSAFLKHIQKYCGVDTSEWANVDNYCMETKGLGKTFRKLSIEELKAAIRQVHAIGGKKKPIKPRYDFIVTNIDNGLVN